MARNNGMAADAAARRSFQVSDWRFACLTSSRAFGRGTWSDGCELGSTHLPAHAEGLNGGFLKTVEELRRISSEVTQGSNVVGNVQHETQPLGTNEIPDLATSVGWPTAKSMYFSRWIETIS